MVNTPLIRHNKALLVPSFKKGIGIGEIPFDSHDVKARPVTGCFSEENFILWGGDVARMEAHQARVFCFPMFWDGTCRSTTLHIHINYILFYI